MSAISMLLLAICPLVSAVAHGPDWKIAPHPTMKPNVVFCQNDVGKWLITRLWEPQCDSSFSTPQVVDAFQCGFAPLVRSLPGFEQYVGATVNTKNSFFYNVFDTRDEASDAQQAAVDFVGATILKSQIQPVTVDGMTAFTEGEILFLFTQDDTPVCLDQNNEGGVLATRLWKITDPLTTAADVAQVFKDGFAPDIVGAEGFLLYGASTVDGRDMVFFWNIFETSQQAQEANDAAVAFVNQAGNPLQYQIEPFKFTSGGIIQFDFKDEQGCSPH